MPRWDIAETRRLLEHRHGREQLWRARHCLRSVTERLRHARYHFQEAKNLLKMHIDDRLEKESLYTLTWPTEPEEWGELDNCLMKVEANMIACAQSIHSIPDILAHVVYFALGFNLISKPLKESNVNVQSVAAVISANASSLAEVKRTLDALTTNSSFAPLNALVNHIKHRGVAEPRLSIEPPDREAPYAMEFGAFTYQDNKYPEREIEEVLAPAYEAASRAVIDTGNAINLVLSR